MRRFHGRLITGILLAGGIAAAAEIQQLSPARQDSLVISGSYTSQLGEFTLYLPADYPSGTEDFLQEMIADLALVLISRFGPVDPAAFELVIVNAREELSAWTGRELPRWIHAVALEHPPRIVVLGPATDISDHTSHNLEQALLHELTHIYLYRLYPSRNGGPLPGWFHEGLAVYFSSGLDRGMHRALIRGRLTNRFYTLGQLDRIYHTSTVLSELAYAQSIVAAQSMTAFYGEDVFHSLFDEIRRGYSFAPAFALAAGENLEQFQTRYKAELHRRYNFLLVLADPSVLFILLPILVLLAYFIRIWRSRIITARWAAEGYGGGDDPGRDITPADDKSRTVDEE
ncbi:MAG: hypothetical protein JSU77_02375 [Fidelibacterota bacterium]|nr:MAG: hypothetical protein JSU77_02375 [Candidatus Neomarinimicrobiota bacterium]